MAGEMFKLSALEALAKIIGDTYTGTEITELFRKAGFPDIVHDRSTKWRFVYQVLENLQKENDGIEKIFKIIEQLCDPQEYFDNYNKFESIRTKVNRILQFYGFVVNEEGKICKSDKKASTLEKSSSGNERVFDERNFHSKVIQHSKKHFVAGEFFHAIFEACKAYEKEVRKKSKIESSGADLMGKAFSLKGRLKLNSQLTETEKNEQEGLMHLSLGLMKAIRNPTAHEPETEWAISKDDALDLLSFISYLFKQLDKTTYIP